MNKEELLDDNSKTSLVEGKINELIENKVSESSNKKRLREEEYDDPDESNNKRVHVQQHHDNENSNNNNNNKEVESLIQGQERIKYKTEYVQNIQPPQKDEWEPLARLLQLIEKYGAAPILPDGKIGGNGAIRCSDNTIVVSKSGKYANTICTRKDFVRLINFNTTEWKAIYGGCISTSTNNTETSSKATSISVDNTDDDTSNENKTKDEETTTTTTTKSTNNNVIDNDIIIRPSSDTPLLWHGLMVAYKKFNWTLQPQFVLHGHSFATEEDAKELNIPCSSIETLFSTPEDLHALMNLFEQYPYPQNQIYIRKNHGFFLLAQNEQEACNIFKEKLIPKGKKQANRYE